MKKISIFFILILLVLIAVSCDQECKHDNMSENTLDATCIQNGQTTYTCLDCGYSYLDNIIEPIGHHFTNKTISPKCTNDGYTEYSCTCGYTYISDIISAVGHDYSDKIIAPTCTDAGYKVHTCKKCDYSYISNHTDPMGHKLSESVTPPTCTEEGYTLYQCDKCDYSYELKNIEPTGHNYTEEVISTVSCTMAGEIKYTCICGDTYSKIVYPDGHDFSKLIIMPTLSDMGYTEYTCKNCQESYTADLRFYSDILENAYANNTEVLAKGIDISHHNYKMNANGEYISLDWEKIKASGVSYVIIRAGDAAIGLDPTFEKSYAEAKAAGLDVGVYFYTRATTVDEISREANLVLSALRDKQFEYPIYLDLEDESLMSIDPAILNEMCVEFFTILQRSGYYTGLYVNNEWLYNIIDKDTALSRFEIWYARYPALSEEGTPVWNEEQNGKHLGMWQYSDSGVIDGIDTTVFDLNLAYKNYPSIIKEGGFNGYETDVKFIDSQSSFVWVTYKDAALKIRSKSDYFTNDDYDSSLDVVGYASYGERFEIVKKNDLYTTIKYNDGIAYISANPKYVSFNGLYFN